MSALRKTAVAVVGKEEKKGRGREGRRDLNPEGWEWVEYRIAKTKEKVEVRCSNC